MLQFLSLSSDETTNCGKKIASLLNPGDIVTLSGDLGAGKTTLMKGLVEELTKIDPRQVTSPTFTYMNIFSTSSITLCHFDLYRINSEQEFISLGLEEYLHQDHICCIEWSEKIESLLPRQRLAINIAYLSEETRQITVVKVA